MIDFCAQDLYSVTCKVWLTYCLEVSLLEQLLAALADPIRRQILDLLRHGPETAGEIARRFPQVSRPAVSQHLAVLRSVGLLREERRGRHRLYHLEAEPLRQLWEGWLSTFAPFWQERLDRLKRLVESDLMTEATELDSGPESESGSDA